MRTLRILHVMNDFPYPPTHGGRVDVWGRLQALARLGQKVDVVATVKDLPSAIHQERVRELASGLSLVRRKANWTGIASSQPVQIATRSVLRNLTLPHAYDAVLLEQEYVAPVLENPMLRAKRTLLRVHNDEPLYYAELAGREPNWWRRTYYRTEGRRFRRASPGVLNRADQLWFISKDHHVQWSAQHPGERARARWLPPAAPAATKRSSSGAHVLIAGNLFQPTNLASIDWYLHHVHPRLLDEPGYELLLAGSTRGKAADDLLSRIRTIARCTVQLNVDDMDGIYRRAAFFVNPMQSGTSVKMKTLDAMRNGIPVITTPVGAEGLGLTPGVHALIEPEPSGMAAAIRTLLADKHKRASLREAAYALLEEQFDHTQHLAELLEL